MRSLLSFISLAALAVVLTMTSSARADNTFSLHMEPGLAVPMTEPQDGIYRPGMALGVKPMLMLDHHLSVGPMLAGMYLPRAVDTSAGAGTLLQLGGVVRLQTDRRTDTHAYHMINDWSPWVDIDVTAATTGNLWRPAAGFSLGMETPLDQNHIAWMGPFVSVQHVFQTADTQDRTLLDSRDINTLIVGLSVSFDTPTLPKTEVVEYKVTKVVHDKVACPPAPVAVASVAPEKFDLSEKVYFDRDSAVLRWESKDKLDAIAKKLNDHPKMNIDVSGHASSEGQLVRNDALANQRTTAVMNYLTSHGVEVNRLKASSHGVSTPSAPNTTKEGRERNRRVEFVVNFTSAK